MEPRADRSPLTSLPLREPGQSVRNAVIDLAFGRVLPVLWITTLACALTILMWVQQTLGLQVSTHAFGMMTLGLAAIAALQLSYIGPKVRALQLGRDGERAVGQFLEQQLLSEGARVIHDIPADGFNLDHVVISPQGVFVIETKTRTKPLYRAARISFAGEGLEIAGYKPDRNPIAQVRASSRWLSELLSHRTGHNVPVRGVVVFPGWFVEPMTRDWLNAGHPWVLEPKSLPRFLKCEPTRLSEAEVTNLSNQVGRYVRDRESAERNK